MKHTYLVTGATGFVGSWITRALVKNGEKVAVLVRDKNLNWRLTDIASRIQIYQCDLQSDALYETINQIRPTVVFHLAAFGALPGQQTSPQQLIDTNVKGLINLLDAIKQHNIKLFINTGSSSEYGIKHKPMKETDTLEPINDYGVSKAAASLYAQKVALTKNLPIITFRLFSPFGYFDDNKRLISYVIAKALTNDPISLSSKTNVRDFIYIEDVVEAYLTAIHKTFHPGELFNIGSGKQHSVYDIVENIIALTNSRSSVHWDSKPRQSRQIEPAVWQADITKSKKQLGWEPKYTLREGLQKTIEDFNRYE